jgi:hypothetical protein
MTRKQEEALHFQNAGVGRWRTVVFCLHWGVGNGTGYPVEQTAAGRPVMIKYGQSLSQKSYKNHACASAGPMTLM